MALRAEYNYNRIMDYIINATKEIKNSDEYKNASRRERREADEYLRNLYLDVSSKQKNLSDLYQQIVTAEIAEEEAEKGRAEREARRGTIWGNIQNYVGDFAKSAGEHVVNDPATLYALLAQTVGAKEHARNVMQGVADRSENMEAAFGRKAEWSKNGDWKPDSLADALDTGISTTIDMATLIYGSPLNAGANLIGGSAAKAGGAAAKDYLLKKTGSKILSSLGGQAVNALPTAVGMSLPELYRDQIDYDEKGNVKLPDSVLSTYVLAIPHAMIEHMGVDPSKPWTPSIRKSVKKAVGDWFKEMPKRFLGEGTEELLQDGIGLLDKRMSSDTRDDGTPNTIGTALEDWAQDLKKESPQLFQSFVLGGFGGAMMFEDVGNIKSNKEVKAQKANIEKQKNQILALTNNLQITQREEDRAKLLENIDKAIEGYDIKISDGITSIAEKQKLAAEKLNEQQQKENILQAEQQDKTLDLLDDYVANMDQQNTAKNEESFLSLPFLDSNNYDYRSLLDVVNDKQNIQRTNLSIGKAKNLDKGKEEQLLSEWNSLSEEEQANYDNDFQKYAANKLYIEDSLGDLLNGKSESNSEKIRQELSSIEQQQEESITAGDTATAETLGTRAEELRKQLNEANLYERMASVINSANKSEEKRNRQKQKVAEYKAKRKEQKANRKNTKEESILNALQLKKPQANFTDKNLAEINGLSKEQQKEYSSKRNDVAVAKALGIDTSNLNFKTDIDNKKADRGNIDNKQQSNKMSFADNRPSDFAISNSRQNINDIQLGEKFYEKKPEQIEVIEDDSEKPSSPEKPNSSKTNEEVAKQQNNEEKFFRNKSLREEYEHDISHDPNFKNMSYEEWLDDLIDKVGKWTLSDKKTKFLNRLKREKSYVENQKKKAQQATNEESSAVQKNNDEANNNQQQQEQQETKPVEQKQKESKYELEKRFSAYGMNYGEAINQYKDFVKRGLDEVKGRSFSEWLDYKHNETGKTDSEYKRAKLYYDNVIKPFEQTRQEEQQKKEEEKPVEQKQEETKNETKEAYEQTLKEYDDYKNRIGKDALSDSFEDYINKRIDFVVSHNQNKEKLKRLQNAKEYFVKNIKSNQKAESPIITDSNNINYKDAVDKLSQKIGVLLTETKNNTWLVDVLFGKKIMLDENRLRKLAQELFEGALCKYIRDNNLSLEQVLTIYKNQPTLNNRTQSQKDFQAYSTPVALAKALTDILGIKDGDTVLEPTAGNGLLLSGITKGADFIINELQDDRANILKAIFGDNVTQNNALKMDMPTSDFVVTNPPFGKNSEITAADVSMPRLKADSGVVNYRLTDQAHIIAANALKAMKADGKAVIIYGAPNGVFGKEGDVRKGGALRFETVLFNYYNVVGLFEVGGNLYSKQGTSFPIACIVIDGKRDTNHELYNSNKAKVKRLTSWEDVFKECDDIKQRMAEGKDVLGNDVSRLSQKQTKQTVENKPQTEIKADNGKEAYETAKYNYEFWKKQYPDTDKISFERWLEYDSTQGNSWYKQAKEYYENNIKQTEKKQQQQKQQNNKSYSLKDLYEWDKKNLGYKDMSYEEWLDMSIDSLGYPTDSKQKTFLKRLKQEKEKIRGTITKEVKEQAKEKAKKEAEKSPEQLNEELAEGIKEAETQAVEEKNTENKTESTDDKVAGDGRLQVTYNPVSQSNSIGALVPTNLSKAINTALKICQETYGNLTDFVAKMVGKTRKQTQEAFAAEQIDVLSLYADKLINGSAMVCADQTGLGKGRVAAGAIQMSKKAGHIPMFCTEMDTLFSDIYRDMRDTGGEKLRPFFINANGEMSYTEDGKIYTAYKKISKTERERVLDNLKKGDLSDFQGENAKYDYIVSTYSQFKDKTDSSTYKTESVNGLLASGKVDMILDEAHNIASEPKLDRNGKEVKPKEGEEEGQRTYRRFMDFTKKANSILFLSATWAKRKGNMAIYNRAIGLDTEEINKQLTRGQGMIELLVMRMAMSGNYIRREQSFEGVKYTGEIVTKGEEEIKNETKLSDEHNEIILDTIQLSMAISDLAKDEEFVRPFAVAKYGENAGLAKQKGKGKELSTDKGNVTPFNTLHNYIGNMLLSIKADRVADEAIKQIKAGLKPVIALEKTGGASVDRFANTEHLSYGQKIKPMTMLDVFKGMMLDQLNNIPIETTTGEKGLKIDIPFDALPEGIKDEYRKIFEKLQKTSLNELPGSPIDRIEYRIRKAGYTVEDITGRNSKIDYVNDNEATFESIGKKDSKVIVNDFNSGNLDCVILNVKGATGISMHASDKFKDKRQRIMLIAQPFGDPNKMMQMLGRIHRVGQISKPVYKYVMTSLLQEIRQSVNLQDKLKSLNANTSSNKEGQQKFSDVDINNVYGQEAIKQWIEKNISIAMDLDLAGYNDKGTKIEVRPFDVKKVTGRINVTSQAVQNEFWDFVLDKTKELIAEADARGDNELNIPSYTDSDAVVLDSRKIAGETKADDYYIKSLDIQINGKPATIENAEARAKEGTTIADNKAAMEELENKCFEYLHHTDERIKNKKNIDINKIKNNIKASHRELMIFLNNTKIGEKAVNGNGEVGVITSIKVKPTKDAITGNPLTDSKIVITMATPTKTGTSILTLSSFRRNAWRTINEYSNSENTYFNGRWEEEYNQNSTHREKVEAITGNLLKALDFAVQNNMRVSQMQFRSKDGKGKMQFVYFASKIYQPMKNIQEITENDFAKKHYYGGDEDVYGNFMIHLWDTGAATIEYRLSKKNEKTNEFIRKTEEYLGKDSWSNNTVYIKDNAVDKVNRFIKDIKEDLSIQFKPLLTEKEKEEAIKESANFKNNLPQEFEEDDVHFSISQSKVSKAIGINKLNAIAKKIGNALNQKLGLGLVVCKDSAELGNKLREAGSNIKTIPTGAEGCVYNGNVYLVADNIQEGNRVYSVLAHEIAGHVGAEKIYPHFNALMKELLKLENSDKKIKAIFDDVRKKYNDKNDIRIASEVFAKVMEQVYENENSFTGKIKNLVNFFIKKVKDFFREKLGIKLDVSTRELYGIARDILAKSTVKSILQGRVARQNIYDNDKSSEPQFSIPSDNNNESPIDKTSDKLIKWGYNLAENTAKFMAKYMANAYDALKKQYDKVPFEKWAKYIQAVTKPNLKGEDISEEHKKEIFDSLNNQTEESRDEFEEYLDKQWEEQKKEEKEVSEDNRKSNEAMAYGKGYTEGYTYAKEEADRKKLEVKEAADIARIAKNKEKGLQYLEQQAKINKAIEEARKPKKTTIAQKFEALENWLAQKFADRRNRLAQFQADIEKATGTKLADYKNPYRQLDTIEGRIENKIEAFNDKYFKPLYDFLIKNKITYDDFNKFTYAMHADERDKYIKEINPTFKDNNVRGSGWDNAKMGGTTEQVLNKLYEKYGKDNLMKAGKMFWKMNDSVIDLQEEYGLITKETADNIRNRYKHYTPLKHIADDEVTTKVVERALGRTSTAQDNLMFATAAIDTTIRWGERNNAKLAMLNLVNLHKTPLVEVNRQKLEQYFNTKTGEVEVRLERNLEPNTIIARANGVNYKLTFKDDDLYTAFTSDNVGNNKAFRAIVTISRTFNSLMGFVSTVANPDFGIANFVRDQQQAGLENTVYRGGKFAGSSIANAFKSMLTYIQYKRGVDNADTRLYKEFLENGGMTGYADMISLEKRAEHLDKKINEDIEASRSLTGKIKKLAKHPSNIIHGLFGIFEEFNNTLESATRFGVYKAKRKTSTALEAAELSKNITINFNRHGDFWNSDMNGIYLFSNASIQGTRKAWQALKQASKTTKGKAMLGSLVMAGFASEILGNMFAGFDPDDKESYYDKLEEWKKDGNIIIFTGDKNYFSIPLSPVIAVPYMAGRNIAAWTLGKKSMTQAFGDMCSNFITTLNPLGEDNRTLGSVVPTFFRPMIELWTNKKWYGGPIRPEQPQRGAKKPEHKLYFEKKTAGVFVDFAKLLSDITGGDEYTGGKLDYSPSDMQYLFEHYTGGLGKSIYRGYKTVTGQKEGLDDIPMARRFYGETNDYGTARTYKENQQISNLFTKAKRERNSDYMKNHPEYRKIHNIISMADKRIDSIHDRTNMTESEKELAVTKIQKQANMVINKLR